jgi:predicted transcriptional regulator
MIMIVVKAQEGRIIKDITIRIADEMDFEFIRGLQNLGMNRNVASLVTYLKDVTEGSSRDIEIATGMRQPEVSIAMQTMKAMDWVTEHDVKGDGKGRPMKYYALRSTIDEIIGYYEAKKSQETAQTMEAIQRLKELSFA